MKGIQVRICYRYYLILCVFLLVNISIIFFFHQPSRKLEREIIHFLENDVISCHYTDGDNALPTVEETQFSPSSNSIFFHETSCNGELNSRQACAVEAAARKHPQTPIYLFFNAPVTKQLLSTSSLAKIREFKNVHVLRVNIQEYAKDTPLEAYVDKLLAESEWPVEHSSDVARLLTLYKWGGLYLDLDMLVVRPLQSFPRDWIARSSDITIGTAIMAVSKSDIGRRFINNIIKEIKTNMKLHSWAYSGTRTINKVLRKMCKRNSLMMYWTEENCTGFFVYPPKPFYPLQYWQRIWYFQPISVMPEGPDTDHIASAYTHHLWNSLTEQYHVDKHSYYAALAKRHCPTIYAMYGRFVF